MPILKLADLDLYYEFEPHRDRPVLVFSNSLGADLSMWTRQMEVFWGDFSILRYDSRGQGRSSSPQSYFAIDDMAGDVIALMDALEIDKVIFCGISMGGLVGQWLAIHRPSRIQCLILSNTAAQIGSLAKWNERILSVQEGGMGSIARTVLDGWFTAGFHSTARDEVERMMAILEANDPSAYSASCRAVRDTDFQDQLGTVTCPTLVIYGTEDRATTPADAQFLVDHIPSARGLSLPAAHIANIEAAAAFNEGVFRFLKDEGH